MLLESRRLPLTRFLFALASVLVTHVAHAQVLSTADTLGRGKTAILLSDNELYAGDGIRLNIAYAMAARGLNERFDIFFSFGETATNGEAQAWIGGGGNLHLAKVKGVSLSAFNIASIPVHRRDEACLVLLNSALVASRPVGPKIFIYSGLNTLIPIGERNRGVFTPPDLKVNVPFGVTYAVGPWGLWGEVDVGQLHALGFGVTRLL